MEVALRCPAPLVETDRILLGHGSGGRMTAELIARYFLPAFQNSYLDRLDDQAVLSVAGERLAFTTDAHVVTPLFFPGGDIGSLAVNGTVNDLAMAGARPLYLSAAFILEEGFPLTDLRRIVDIDERSGEGGRGAPGHGRHEGGRPGQSGWLLHHHGGHRSRHAWRHDLGGLAHGRAIS